MTNNDGLISEGPDVPKPKRVACAICRKRKLKCDGGRPKCGTCARLGHNCAYDEVRRKSGPKRGYVKELEARLAQVETQLKTKAKTTRPPTPCEISPPQDQHVRTPSTDHAFTSHSGEGDHTMYAMGIQEQTTNFLGNMALPNGHSTPTGILPDLVPTANPLEDNMTWEMVGLGLEEPLPTQEAIDELHDIYFKSMHASLPMIHQYRYRAAMGLAPHMRPPVLTNLPANEENFDKSIPEETIPLSAGMTPEGVAKMSPFAGVVYMASVFGKNLAHLHRPGTEDKDDDLQGDFWKRHRQLDNTLLKTSLSLPAQLRLPAGIRNPNCVFLNMCIHTSTICLHQAAIFKAELKRLPSHILEQSSTRCLLAATEVANIMRLISHLDCHGMNPFIAFCLYVAARVFIHILKKSPDEAEIRSSLEFLLAAMQQFKTTNPLSESFLIQLSLDLQGTSMDFLLQNPAHSSTTLAKLDLMNKHESHVTCSPIVDIRDSNKHIHPSQIGPRLSKSKPPMSMPQFPPNGRELSSAGCSQYSMQSFEVSSRDSPRSRPGTLGHLDGSGPDFLQRASNGEAFGGGFPGGATGLGSMENAYDTDMSVGHDSSRPSPENSSTNTSYSPHSQNAEINSTTVPKPTSHRSADNTVETPKFFNFTNGEGNFVSAAPDQPPQASADFDVPSSSWNFDAVATSQSTFTSGLTPAADGVEWTEIMNNMNWDSTMLDANNTPWTASPEGAR
ncbi:MAG: hypothetical protein Q9219_000446 [cf. Caloplaca sp. 3 TL-2023]